MLFSYVKHVIQKFTGEVTKISGGHFDYQDMRISELIDTLGRDNYDTKKIEKLLESMMNILHAYDWFMCGDTGESDFKKEYYKELQKIKELVK